MPITKYSERISPHPPQVSDPSTPGDLVQTSRPVWFVQEADTFYLLPVAGSDTEWFKNVLHNPTLTLAASGITWTAKAKPITDSAKVGEVVEKFRAKYGAGNVKKYYSKFDVAVEVPLA